MQLWASWPTTQHVRANRHVQACNEHELPTGLLQCWCSGMVSGQEKVASKKITIIQAELCVKWALKRNLFTCKFSKFNMESLSDNNPLSYFTSSLWLEINFPSHIWLLQMFGSVKSLNGNWLLLWSVQALMVASSKECLVQTKIKFTNWVWLTHSIYTAQGTRPVLQNVYVPILASPIYRQTCDNAKYWLTF